jgi:hypothetical protein
VYSPFNLPLKTLIDPKALLPKQLPSNNMKKKNFARGLAIVAVVGLTLSALLPALSGL